MICTKCRCRYIEKTARSNAQRYVCEQSGCTVAYTCGKQATNELAMYVDPGYTHPRLISLEENIAYI